MDCQDAANNMINRLLADQAGMREAEESLLSDPEFLIRSVISKGLHWKYDELNLCLKGTFNRKVFVLKRMKIHVSPTRGEAREAYMMLGPMSGGFKQKVRTEYEIDFGKGVRFNSRENPELHPLLAELHEHAQRQMIALGVRKIHKDW